MGGPGHASEIEQQLHYYQSKWDMFRLRGLLNSTNPGVLELHREQIELLSDEELEILKAASDTTPMRAKTLLNRINESRPEALHVSHDGALKGRCSTLVKTRLLRHDREGYILGPGVARVLAEFLEAKKAAADPKS